MRGRKPTITGLTFLFGGYHRLGGCVARGQAGYTVYDERHWALEGCDLFYGDVIGGEIPFLGYENDGCRFQFDRDGRPRPVPELGVPDNLEIIALAPTAFGEDRASGYPMLIPPENLRDHRARRVRRGGRPPQKIASCAAMP